MKNLRLKITLLLTLCITVVTVCSWIKSTQKIDIVMTKNLVNRSVKLDRILRIEDLKTRQAEGNKFIVNLDQESISNLNHNSDLFGLLTILMPLTLISFILVSVELAKRKK